ncbi:MAG: hypothetical protein LBS49_13215 [Candidatus Accumulibacter sp.]|jgi:hypothetical protein|nr:hypothetical protein [Accumulibacter sp.]
MLDLSIFLRRYRALALALLAAPLALPSFAQHDPPGRVGRIAWMSGDVYLNPPDGGELSAAPLNQPLTSGDVVSTGSDARAEIQVGAMTLRLDANSRIELVRIDDGLVRVLLNGGRLIARLPSEDSRRDFVLETGQGRFFPRDTGVYRFDLDDGGATATTYFGSLRFEGQDVAFDVNAGQSARVWNDAAGQLDYRMAQGASDEFTQWSAARDQSQPASASSPYVSPEMTGAQDLDAYGDWSETPDYGAVWFPRALASDWAPYRNGHWAWVSPWGWNWIGYEPWGFAPYHYGRWVRHRGAWGWAPGRRMARPVYAPALVGWIGTPGGASPGIGTARSVAWFPLAPREAYTPFYRASPSHVRLINAPHLPRSGNAGPTAAPSQDAADGRPFAYRHELGALSVASDDAFGHRRPGVRIMPRPGDAREFHGREEHSVPPAREAARRAQGADPSQGSDSPRPGMDRPARKPPPDTAGETPFRRDRMESAAPRTDFTAPRSDSPPPESRRERRENVTPRTLAPTSAQPPRPAMQAPAKSRTAPSARERGRERPREVRRPEPRRSASQRIERRTHDRQRHGGSAIRRQSR